MSSRRTISNTFTVTTMDDPVSVQAQYSPDKTVVHTVWQEGDLYMRTRESDDAAWSSWHKIVGENGGETDYSFYISAYSSSVNAQTAPEDIQSSNWQDTPMQVTDARPYLWMRTQKKAWNSATQSYDITSTSYVRINGESLLAGDLSQEWYSVSMTNLGETSADITFETTIHVYYGSTLQRLSGQPTVGTLPTGVTVQSRTTGGKVTFKIAANTSFTNDRVSIPITATCAKGSVTKDLLITGIRGGAVYQLVPSVSEVVKHQDGTFTPIENITCSVSKITNGITSTPVASEYTLRMKVNGGSEQDYAALAPANIMSSIVYVLYVGGVVVDRESVPLVSDGEDGISITSADVVFGLSTSETTAPSPDDTTTWKTSIADLSLKNSDKDKYIWQCTKITYSNGNTVYTGKMCLGIVSSFADIVEQYALGTASDATGTWQDTTPPTMANGYYLWTRTKLVYSDNSVSYAPSANGYCVGYYGIDGTSITGANVWYALSTSNSLAPQDSAFTLDNFPTTLNAGYYVWEATKITFSSGNPIFTGKMCLGATSDFLSGTEVYAISTSNSTAPADNQFSTTYSKTKGYYLWTATRVQYTNGTYAYLNKKCVGYWGEDGEEYIIESSQGSVVIESNQTTGTLSGVTLSFFKKEGGKEREAYSCFCTIFQKKGSTYTAIRQYTTAGAAVTYTHTAGTGVPAITAENYDAIVVCIYNAASTSHSGYLTELEIPVRKNGDDNKRLDLDNEHEDFLYDDAGNRKSAIVTSQARFYEGATQITSNITWAVSCFDDDSHWVSSGNNYTGTNAKAKISSEGLLTVEEIYVTTAKIRVRATYASKFYYAEFTANKQTQDKYDLLISPTSIPYNPANYSQVTVAISAKRTSITGGEPTSLSFGTYTNKTKISSTRGKGYLRVFALTRQAPAPGVIEYIPTQITANSGNGSFNVDSVYASERENAYIELRRYDDCDTADDYGRDGVLVDWENIPICKSLNGTDGTSPYFADLDNEMDSIACTNDGKPSIEQTVETNVKLYRGSTALSPTLAVNDDSPSGAAYTSGTAKDGITVTWNNTTGNIKFKFGTSNSRTKAETFCITLTVTDNGATITRYLYFTVNCIRAALDGNPAELYRLVPSVNEIVKKKDGTYTPTGTTYITCDVTKNVGGTQSTPSASEYTLKYSLNGGAETTYTATSVRANQVTSNLVFILYVNSIVVDRETIPLVSDGIDGTSPYFADLDNEMDAIQCKHDGSVITDQTVSTVISMWKGSAVELFVIDNIYRNGTQLTWDGNNNGVWPSVSGSTVSLEFTTSASIADIDDFKITIHSYNDNTVTRELHFTINGVRANAIYRLVPSHSQIVKKKDGTYVPSGNVTCSVEKTENGSTSTPDASEYTLEKSVNGGSYTTYSATAASSITSDLKFRLKVGGVVVDLETIPLVSDGDKGNEGKGYKAVVTRNNFTESNWATYGESGHSETWSNTSSTRGNCKTGDWFIVVGTATDTKNYHIATYECSNDSGDLAGTCINHQITKDGLSPNPNILLRTVFDRGIDKVKEKWEADWSYVGIDGASDTIVDGRKCIRINASSISTYKDFSQDVYGKLKTSTWYTLSFDFFSTHNFTTLIWDGNNSSGIVDRTAGCYIDGVFQSLDLGIDGSHEWTAQWSNEKRHSISFKTKSSFGTAHAYILFRCPSGAQVAICMPKLELGENATTYIANEDDLVGNEGQSIRGKIGRFFYYAGAWSIAPSDISSWSDAPLATTTQKPYLWSKVQKKDSNGNNFGSATYIKLTGEDGDTVEAQYAPNNNPTSSQIHTTWQDGDLYMRTKQSNETNWSSWHKIVGESGDETDFSFGISQYNASTDSFLVSDAQAPYFYYNNNYWVFNPETNGTYTKQDMGIPSSSSSNWLLMTSDFTYIITEAIFGAYAHFGSFIINGDWLLSTNGKVGESVVSGESYVSGSVIGGSIFSVKAVTLFDSAYPSDGMVDIAYEKNTVTIATSETTKQIMTVYLSVSLTYRVSCDYSRGGGSFYVRIRHESYGSVVPIYLANASDSASGNFRVTTSGTYIVEIYTTSTGYTASVWNTSVSRLLFAPMYAVDGKTGASYQGGNGVFRGFVRKQKTRITTSNINQYKRTDITSATVLDFDKCGSFIELATGTYGYITLPLMSNYLASRYTSKQIDDIRSFVGTTMLIYNKSGQDIPMTLRYNSNGSTTSGTIHNGNCVELECCLDADSNDGKEIIYWKVISYAEPVV